MDAYIDLSFIFHCITLFNLPYYFKKIVNYNFSKLEVLGLIVFSLVLYSNAFIFSSYTYLNLLFIFIYFLILYQKKGIKYYLVYLIAYYGSISLSLILNSNLYLFKTLIFLSKPSAFFSILFELVNIILIEIIFFSIKSIKLLKNYRVEIKVLIDNHFNKFKGYIDSGNTLEVEGLPVIFLKDSYFKNKDYPSMVVNGIGKQKCKYFKTIVILNERKREVICASSNKSFKGCDCLININLVEGNYD